MKGKQINKTDLNNINLMLSKGFGIMQISRIIGCSDTTVGRVRDGRHVLQLVEKPAEHQSEKIKGNAVEQKLDVIIGLLNDIKEEWK